MSYLITASGFSQNNADQEDDTPANGSGSDTLVITRQKTRTKEPSLYRVLLHNDDYTPMEFVVEILEDIFQMDAEKAYKIMMDVHQKGQGCCGVFPYDIAETKVALVTAAARENEYPLKCSMEKSTTRP